MKRAMMIAASAAALHLAAGCVSTDEAGTSRIFELENQLETTEQSLEAERAAKNALANQVKSMGEKPVMESDRRVGGNADLPPNAQPGHCYARVLIPATYKTSTEQVIARGESERVETTAAKYGTNTQRVLVAEESERIDGVYGRQTKDAVARYQRSKGLPTGGLTMDTLRAASAFVTAPSAALKLD
jgi:peptidoglycan hydrolase-like protein with peptidoglycan-binding domain